MRLDLEVDFDPSHVIYSYKQMNYLFTVGMIILIQSMFMGWEDGYGNKVSGGFEDVDYTPGPYYDRPHCHLLLEEDTPRWRAGPEEKPVLCNACGSRWRLRGNLNDYVPKHGIRDASGNIHKLPSKKHAVRITSQQKLRAGKMPKEGEFSISSSESSVTSPVNCMLTQGTEVCLSGEAAQWPVWYPKNVTRRKRSNLQKQPSSLIDILVI
nr:GATA transcription factor 26-like [Ipomoea batatas]